MESGCRIPGSLLWRVETLQRSTKSNAEVLADRRALLDFFLSQRPHDEVACTLPALPSPSSLGQSGSCPELRSLGIVAGSARVPLLSRVRSAAVLAARNAEEIRDRRIVLDRYAALKGKDLSSPASKTGSPSLWRELGRVREPGTPPPQLANSDLPRKTRRRPAEFYTTMLHERGGCGGPPPLAARKSDDPPLEALPPNLMASTSSMFDRLGAFERRAMWNAQTLCRHREFLDNRVPKQ
mmetsp:Transcript_61559/g.133237  ORF Transcript_61559/g.133237 Transcript_61559/m.133237 type:complete len:239 (+) Transcript_61559:110-826(+)